MAILAATDAPTVRTIMGVFAPTKVVGEDTVALTDAELINPAWTVPVEHELTAAYPDAAYATGHDAVVVRTAAAYLLSALIIEGQRRVVSGQLADQRMQFADGQYTDLAQRWRATAWSMLNRTYPVTTTAGIVEMFGGHVGLARGSRG